MIAFFAMLFKWFMATLVTWFLKQIFIATVLPWFEDVLGAWQRRSTALYQGFKSGFTKAAEVAVGAVDATVEGASA